MAFDLQERQRAALIRMLNLNEQAQAISTPSTGFGISSESQAGWGDSWKVVVYDHHGRDIISPLLNVGALRKQGVTLHMLLDSAREPIGDVPAVYFCAATEENIDKIAEDAKRGLYAGMHVNFCARLGRELMEALARRALRDRSVANITRVYDQYLDFVALEPSLFSLGFPECYRAYSAPGAGETEVGAALRRAAFGLFSAVAALGAVPVIRAPKGGAAEVVARELSGMIADHLASPGAPFFRGGGGAGGAGAVGAAALLARPLLVVLDRSADLVTPLRHGHTYQALVDDALPHRLNRVKIEAEGAATKTYDLDKASDKFFKRYAGRPFPEAIEANGAELAEVGAREAELRRRTDAKGGGGGGDGAAAAAAAAGGGGPGPRGGEDLLGALDSLPAIMERKKLLEAHTNILQAVMGVVAAREIPHFFELEEEMVASRRCDRAKLEALLGDPAKGSLRDKLRLLGVFCLATDAPGEDARALQAKLRAAYAEGEAPPGLDEGLAALDYLRAQRSLQHLPSAARAEGAAGGGGGAGAPPPPGSSSGGGGGGALLSGLLGKGAAQAAGAAAIGLLAKAKDAAAAALTGKDQRLYVSRVVERLVERRECAENAEWLYLDPRAPRGAGSAAPPPPAAAGGGGGGGGPEAAPFQQAVAFVVGPGCYAEYQNLQDLAAAPGFSARTVVYGCAELQSPEAFLGELGALAAAAGAS